MANTREVKLCLLGDQYVGKSSIVHRFVYDSFNPSMDCTVGAAFYSKIVKAGDFNVKYQIWDTAGQERYRALVPLYYKDAAAAIVVYDISNKTTFMSVKTWISEIRQHGDTNCQLVVIGNKCDLTTERQVEKAEAAAFAANHNALFLETSAKMSINIGELFVELGDRLVAKNRLAWKEETRDDSIRPSHLEPIKRSSCCSR